MNNYPGITTYATILKASAVLLAIANAIFLIISLGEEYTIENLYFFFEVLLIAIALWAVSDLLKLLMDIGSNIFETKILLTKSLESNLKPKSSPFNEYDNSVVINDIDEEQESLSGFEITKIKDLRMRIESEKQITFFGKRNTGIITEILYDMAPTYEKGMELLGNYRKLYHSDLIQDLKKLSSRYDTMKKYLQPLIKIGLVQSNYPHDLIKKEG